MTKEVLKSYRNGITTLRIVGRLFSLVPRFSIFANLCRSAGFLQIFLRTSVDSKKMSTQKHNKNPKAMPNEYLKCLELERSLIYIKMMKHFSAGVCREP